MNMQFSIRIFFVSLFVFGQFFFASVSHAAAPTITHVSIQNIGIDAVNLVIDGDDLVAFFTTGFAGANRSIGAFDYNPTDLDKVTYNGVHPDAGGFTSDQSGTFQFPLAVGTGKSGGAFTVDAGTIVDLSDIPNLAISVPDTDIDDQASPVVFSIDSDGATYAIGDTPTVTMTFTENIANTPTVSVAPDGGAQTVGNCGDGNARTFCFNYAVPALTDTTETITIDAAKDSLNQTMDPDATHAFAVDTIAPVISEATPVSTPATDATPAYVFTTNDTGTISYGGDCTSATTSVASPGQVSITFSGLATGVHSNCTITLTDAAGNASNTLALSAFTITAPPTPPSPSSSGGGYNPNPSEIPGYVPTMNADGTCAPYLSVYMRQGARGEAVMKLQAFLRTQGFFTYPADTGFFGLLTELAVKGFQEKYRADILTPQYLLEPTGFVVNYTIAKINAIVCTR